MHAPHGMIGSVDFMGCMRSTLGLDLGTVWSAIAPHTCANSMVVFTAVSCGRVGPVFSIDSPINSLQDSVCGQAPSLIVRKLRIF